MVFLDYKKLRVLILVLIGFMPLFFMTVALGLGLTWVGGALAGIGMLFIILIIGYAALGKNAWIKAVEQEGILLFNLNSTGVVPVGIARIKQNKFGQKLFSFQQGNEEVSRLYDREVAWTLKQPLEGQYEVLRNPDTQKKVIRIELEEDSFAKAVFFTSYLQVLIFNEQSGSFVTKSELGDQERDKLITYLTLNEQRELRELNATLNNFIRNYADRLNEVLGGIVSSTGFKVIVVIIILLVVGALAWFFVPGFQETVVGVPQGVQQVAATGLPDIPLNT